MKWIPLTSASQLEEMIGRSAQKPQVIFKYSTQCSLSDMIRNRLEKNASAADIDFYFLDLIGYRSISDLVSMKFRVRHESPQVLLIRNGACVYEESHWGIRMDEIIAQAMAA